MKTTVIYHRADFDGIFCREIARKFLPDAELIGWDYGDPKIPFPSEGMVYVLDLSPDCFEFMDGNSIPDYCTAGTPKRLIWIDHHKSAIDKYGATGLHDKIPGYRIDGVAACRLAWQYFTFFDGASNKRPIGPNLPEKQHYVDRIVQEPWAVRLAGEYDIWDKRDERAELFQHGLRSQELTTEDWAELLDEKAVIGFAAKVQKLLQQGQGIQYARTQENESIIKAAGFTLQFEGLTFLACNHARYNSLLFTAGLKPEHDACFGFAWRDGKWTVSLYHAPGKEHHDLSQIAVKYGGGGHRGACGFQTKTLPFLT